MPAGRVEASSVIDCVYNMLGGDHCGRKEVAGKWRRVNGTDFAQRVALKRLVGHATGRPPQAEIQTPPLNFARTDFMPCPVSCCIRASGIVAPSKNSVCGGSGRCPRLQTGIECLGVHMSD